MSVRVSALKKKISFQEKRNKLKSDLLEMKKKLNFIEEKRKIELGSLMMKYNLGDIEDSILDVELKLLSEKLNK